MADPISQYLYPEDITGAATTNKVGPERQTLNPPDEELDFHWIIPKAAPYFRDTMKLYNVVTGLELKRGIDWAPGHKFISASYETQGIKGGIYGSILLMDNTLSGQVEMRVYQTLGGTWTLDETTILELLDAKSIDPRSVAYEEVADLPDAFPPIEHPHNADDVTGMREQVDATYDIAAAIRERTQDWLDNPPLLPELYYSRDEIDAKLADIGGGSNPEDLELIVTSLTTSFSDAADQLEAIQAGGPESITDNMVLMIDDMKDTYSQAADQLGQL